MKDSKTQALFRPLQFIIRNVLWWTCVALVAIVIAQANPLLGIGVALVGGLVFGILLFV